MDAAVAQDDGAASPDPDASVLRHFENTIQTGPGSNHASPTQRKSSHAVEESDKSIGRTLGDDLVSDIMSGVLDGIATFVVDGGRATLQRVAPDDPFSPRRNNGDALIPFVRYDFGYQRISSRIDASFNQLEGGYGPFALYIEAYSFHESVPASVLMLQRKMFLYRVAGQHIEVDVGIGQTVVTGAKRNSMGAFSVRGKVMLTDHASMDFTPVWGDGMDDYELAYHWGRPYGSFTVGYRSLQTSGASLNGPFAGFALYF